MAGLSIWKKPMGEFLLLLGEGGGINNWVGGGVGLVYKASYGTSANNSRD